jgi:hypothetical protein
MKYGFSSARAATVLLDGVNINIYCPQPYKGVYTSNKEENHDE